MYGSGEPFKVVFDSLHNQILNTPIHIEIINQDQYKLKLNTESASTYNYRLNTSGINLSSINIEQTYRFGEVVDANWGRFKIENTKGTTSSDQEMYFVFNHPYNIAAHYKSRLRTYRANESSSIIRVSVTGKNNQKNITFLNQLAKVFIANNLEQKNQIATNTITFIEEQLGVISDSLFLTGSQLSQFRTDNRIQSVSAKAEYLFNGLQEIEQQLAQHEITKRYYHYLKNYFSDNITGNDVIAPAQYDTENNLLAEQIRQIMELNSQRLSLTYSEDQNLFNRDIETQINIATQTLIKTINSQLDVLNETIARLQATKSKNEQELYTLPETERKLLGIERKFELSNEVYTFLLRKRSESQIQKASNTPDHQILEAAQGNGIIAPNISGNRKNAFLLGLILPLAFVGLRQLLNNKILAEEDINKITNIPVIGQVLHNTKEESNVIQHHPKSVITESFRRVRTRLDYLTQDIPCPVVSVSSSVISGEKARPFVHLILQQHWLSVAKKQPFWVLT